MDKSRQGRANPKALVAEHKNFLRRIVRETMQQLLEAEMTDAIGAKPGERTGERLGYRAGHYPRTLVTGVGKLELRVPCDRDGRFSTALFERYQRSEKAVGPGARGDVRAVSLDAQGQSHHRGTLSATASSPRP